MSPADIAAVIAGGVLTWLVLAAFTVIVGGQFFAVSNPQHHRRMSHEQGSGHGQSDRLGRVTDGGQVNNFHSQDDY